MAATACQNLEACTCGGWWQLPAGFLADVSSPTDFTAIVNWAKSSYDNDVLQACGVIVRTAAQSTTVRQAMAAHGDLVRALVEVLLGATMALDTLTNAAVALCVLAEEPAGCQGIVGHEKPAVCALAGHCLVVEHVRNVCLKRYW